jgi:hypothetical protein
MNPFIRSILGMSLLLVAAVPAAAQGRIAFAFERHAFEPIDEGDTTSVVFRFTNEGDAPFSLLEVRPSCGCTTPSYTTGPIEAGASGEILVTYHSEGRPGPYEKSVYVVAEGSEPRSVTLHISGDVIPDFTVSGVRQGDVVFDADVWTVADLQAGEPVQHAFRFQNQGERPLRIREARALGEGVDVIFPDRPLFTGDIAAILVLIDDPAAITSPSGRLDLAVQLVTTDEAQPTKSLRVRGRLTTGG